MSARCGIAFALLWLALGERAGAQDKHKRAPAATTRTHREVSAPKHKAKPDKAKADKAKPEKPAAASSHEPPRPTSESTERGSPPPAADLGGEDVRKEGGTEVKTLEFGGLDIEGQLKTPQMLYFLNRLRAEFERPQLPHRSFMPELQRTTKENTF